MIEVLKYSTCRSIRISFSEQGRSPSLPLFLFVVVLFGGITQKPRRPPGDKKIIRLSSYTKDRGLLRNATAMPFDVTVNRFSNFFRSFRYSSTCVPLAHLTPVAVFPHVASRFLKPLGSSGDWKKKAAGPRHREEPSNEQEAARPRYAAHGVGFSFRVVFISLLL